MCDKAAYEKLREDVDALKKDQAVHDAKSEERFKTLFGILKWVISFMLTITMILLLTVIYGAIGERGFHSVTHAANGISTSTTQD
jgi:formate hydrogenlyase subunit 4